MLASFLHTARVPARSAFPATRGFARLTLIGRLGADPELKTASNGAEYVKYVVATDNAPGPPAPDGTRPERSSTWHNIVSFIPTTHPKLTSLRRGARVYVEAAYEMRRLEANEEFPARQYIAWPDFTTPERIKVLDKGPNAVEHSEE